jgi:hypothetical protein
VWSFKVLFKIGHQGNWKQVYIIRVWEGWGGGRWAGFKVVEGGGEGTAPTRQRGGGGSRVKCARQRGAREEARPST